MNWFKDVFGQAEDDPDREERVAGRVVANWASLPQKGTTLGVEIEAPAEAGTPPQQEQEGGEMLAAVKTTGGVPKADGSAVAPAQEHLQSV